MCVCAWLWVDGEEPSRFTTLSSNLGQSEKRTETGGLKEEIEKARRARMHFTSCRQGSNPMSATVWNNRFLIKDAGGCNRARHVDRKTNQTWKSRVVEHSSRVLLMWSMQTDIAAEGIVKWRVQDFILSAFHSLLVWISLLWAMPRDHHLWGGVGAWVCVFLCLCGCT